MLAPFQDTDVQIPDLQSGPAQPANQPCSANGLQNMEPWRIKLANLHAYGLPPSRRVLTAR